jgi:SAM-dependent methyltransferase
MPQCHTVLVGDPARPGARTGAAGATASGATASGGAFAARAASYSRSVWHAELAERFGQWLDLPRGSRVLDLGTGTGFGAFAVCRSTAPGIRVHGVDISRPMIEVARGRAAELGCVRQVTFSVGDAQRLAIRDRSADAALFVTSLHYMALGQALAECRRVLRPRGTVAVATLKAGALGPAAHFRQTLRGHDLDAPDRMALIGSAEKLRGVLHDSGAGGIDLAEQVMRLSDTDIADAWSVNSKIYARRLSAVPEGQVADIRREFLASMESALTTDEEAFRAIGIILARAEF